MFKHRPIIIPEIYGKNPICDYTPQTAQVLSRLGYPTYIFLINYPAKLGGNFEKKSNNFIYVYPLKLLPLNRFSLIRQVEVHLSFNLLHLYCFLAHFHRPIYWIFYPHLHQLIKHSLKAQSLVYDIIDYFPSQNVGKKYFLSSAKLITSISQSLINSYLKKVPFVKINLVPQGFSLIRPISSIHPEIKKLQSLQNKVGYIGAINNRLDFELLFKLISATPDVNYIFIGPHNTDANTTQKPIDSLASKLFSFKNVHHIGLIPKNQIGQFINLLDIAIIPYDIKDDFNRFCYPMKLFEYFAAGKPVISTAIEELKNFPNLVFVSHSANGWKKIINKILSKPWSAKLQQQEKLLAQKNCWKNKINQILRLLSKYSHPVFP